VETLTDEVLRESQSLQLLVLLETAAKNDSHLVSRHVELFQFRLLLQIGQSPQFIASQVDHFGIDLTRVGVCVQINQQNPIASKQNE
jgi:hypothetical protein